MLKIKSDDEVIILAGKDKGKRGKVRRVLDDNRILVSGVNMVKKHTKANPQAGALAVFSRMRAPSRFPMWQFSIRTPIRQIVWALK